MPLGANKLRPKANVIIRNKMLQLATKNANRHYTNKKPTPEKIQDVELH